jgi:Uma2 family endonuclease
MALAATSPSAAPFAEEPDVSGLVIDDDTPVDILSEKQARLLTEPLYSSWSGPPPGEDGQRRAFAALADVGLFPSPDEPPVVPDMMLSLDVTVGQDMSEKKNRTYFVWRFGKPPEVVVEIVSNREGGELGERQRCYRRMRVSYYVVYDPLHELGDALLRTYEMRGDLYVSVDRPWFESVGLGLVLWEGAFEGTHAQWLRWCTRDGQLVPTGAERAASAEARGERRGPREAPRRQAPRARRRPQRRRVRFGRRAARVSG